MPFVEDTEGRYIGCWGATEPNHGSDLVMGGDDPDEPSRLLSPPGRRRVGDQRPEVVMGFERDDRHALPGLPQREARAGDARHRHRGRAAQPSRRDARGQPLNKLGQRPLNQGEIFFDDVRIPAHYMLAEPPLAGRHRDHARGRQRRACRSTFSGVARAAFEEALAYTQTPHPGRGADLEPPARPEAALRHVHAGQRGEGPLSQGQPAAASGHPTAHYSMAAKVFATRTAFDVASDASELFGAHGHGQGRPGRSTDARRPRGASSKTARTTRSRSLGAQRLLG